MAERRYRIQHPDGRAYDVSMAAFHKLYEPDGFKLAGNADGSELEKPAARATGTRERDRSASARKGAATRSARKAAAAAARKKAIDSAARVEDDEGEA